LLFSALLQLLPEPVCVSVRASLIVSFRVVISTATAATSTAAAIKNAAAVSTAVAVVVAAQAHMQNL
jgi:hypothetical protein